MKPLVSSLCSAISSLEHGWAADAALDGVGDAELVALIERAGELRRRCDAVLARLTSEVAHRSRAELGAESLAKQRGFRNPIVLVAAATGTTMGDAARLAAVGDATTPRMTFSGDAAPARHPHVAAAVGSGALGAQAAAMIVRMLDRVALRAEPSALDDAERVLVEKSRGLTADQVGKLVARAEARLHPDGVEPREQQLREQRSLHLFERNGMVHLSAKLDPVSAAPIKTALEALVSAELRATRNSRGGAGAEDADAPRRTIPQLQADALMRLAEHALGCERSDLPLTGATVIVRIDITDLESGIGHATIDGIDQPVSVASARRMAGGGGIIPCVLGGPDAEILHWGRTKRLFTPAQKLALVERDGGCAMCGAPPGITKGHHIRWWERDAGPTDLDNGVLLCESCHHRIHDNGWEIVVDGRGMAAKVWFVPPPHVDPARTPRLGGRARFDLAA